MSSRPGICTAHKVPHPSLPEPNLQAPWISAQIRMNWPLGCDERTALLALHEAYVKAIDDVRTKFAHDRERLPPAEAELGVARENLARAHALGTEDDIKKASAAVESAKRRVGREVAARHGHSSSSSE